MRTSASYSLVGWGADAPAPPRSSANNATQTAASQPADARVGDHLLMLARLGDRLLATRPRRPVPPAAARGQGRHGGSRSPRPAVPNAGDVDARERCVLTGGCHPSPRTGVGPRCGPPAGDQVALGQQQVDVPAQVGEGGSERRGDLPLSLRAWRSRGRTQVVAEVVIGKDLMGKLNVAAIPDLLVEPPHRRLVLLHCHAPSHRVAPARDSPQLRLVQRGYCAAAPTSLTAAQADPYRTGLPPGRPTQPAGPTAKVITHSRSRDRSGRGAQRTSARGSMRASASLFPGRLEPPRLSHLREQRQQPKLSPSTRSGPSGHGAPADRRLTGSGVPCGHSAARLVRGSLATTNS
jgi:hypothetical protein